MTLMRLNPYRSLFNVKNEFDRLFSQWDNEAPTHTHGWKPAVDIHEDEGHLNLNIDLPGMEKEDISINVENNVLSVSGERKVAHEVNEEDCHRVERSFGQFFRSFTLPTKVETDKIEARYDKGVLTVSLPKKEEAKPRQIEISVN